MKLQHLKYYPVKPCRRNSCCSDAATETHSEETNLELLDPLLDGVYVGAELEPSQLVEFSLRLTQPAPHGPQIGHQLLPLLQVLLVPVLVTQSLSLDQLPALDHT